MQLSIIFLEIVEAYRRELDVGIRRRASRMFVKAACRMGIEISTGDRTSVWRWKEALGFRNRSPNRV